MKTKIFIFLFYSMVFKITAFSQCGISLGNTSVSSQYTDNNIHVNVNWNVGHLYKWEEQKLCIWQTKCNEGENYIKILMALSTTNDINNLDISEVHSETHYHDADECISTQEGAICQRWRWFDCFWLNRTSSFDIPCDIADNQYKYLLVIVASGYDSYSYSNESSYQFFPLAISFDETNLILNDNVSENKFYAFSEEKITLNPGFEISTGKMFYGFTKTCNEARSVIKSNFVNDVTTDSSIKSFEEKNNCEEYLIYPNPTTGIVQFSETASKLKLLDLTGKLLLTKTNVNQLDLSSISNGTYIILIYNENNIPIFRHTLIKQ